MTAMFQALLAIPQLGPEAAGRICAIIRRHAGIAMSPDKSDLLRNRLAPRLRALGLHDFDDYAALIESREGAAEIPNLVEATTTHTTSFFREGRQYRWLAEEGLPALAAAAPRDWLVWSAACSTGAELWSAAMVLEEFGRSRGRPVGWSAIGTDISRPILARAEAAIYAEEEIQGIPEPLRRRHLLRSLPGRAGPKCRRLFRIAPELRARARFLRVNLLSLGDAPRFQADIAFLRNVLIYFDRTDQAKVVASVTARIRPGGYLLTGHAEALFAPPRNLVPVASSIYRKEE